jgi:LPXTG-motif cell wall-anchored protein
VTITSGPTEGQHVTSSSVTFTFQASSAATFQCALDQGAAANCDSGTVTYTQLANGQHSFEVVATETSTSAVAPTTRTFVVAVPPQATITSKPPNPSTSTEATFSFTSDQPGSTFECALDGGTFAACTSPVTYRNLAQNQSHTFAVQAVSADFGTGPAVDYQWLVKGTTPAPPPPPPPPPPPSVETTITGSPANPTASRDATFYFTSNYKNATFQCSLNDGQPSGCTSPVTYTNLSPATHTFKVVASAGQLAGKTPATYTWTIEPALQTTITKKPSNPSSDKTATFEFTANLAGATFECSLNGAAFAACTSPKTYDNLSPASHTFKVRARAGTVVDSSPATFTWTVEASSSSSNTWLWVVLGVVVLALLGALGYFLYRRRRAAQLLAWQRIAVVAPPPERCHGEGDYVMKRDCRLRAGPRQVEMVTLRGASAAGGEITRETSDEVVDGLNRAVEDTRLRRGKDTVRESLAPVAIQLLGEADTWRDGWSGGKIMVGALLVGGKSDCEFTRFRCVAEGSHRVWKATDTWRGVVDDEADEVVGEIRLADGGAQSDGLVEALLAFVEQVDVPDTGPPAS